ncbi:M64 family metallopeptidase [Maribellus sp. YY47]|uniref:M64 family metallopeptidase n=1 Tax=Maribellus sp. YY47 TaxID=2929486 RepID=UPI002000F64A|nr:M64 family metallopeptidase [Maribellus sp. YY47]MCK3682941.1 IgA Peptidase M64 [Maribellus sp. YY47]
MKRLILWLFMIIPIFLNAQIEFKNYFTDHSLRFDFLLGGNSKTATIYPEAMKQEPFWAGNKNHLVDEFNYGTYRYRVFDAASNQLIFSKGFSTLFQEWQTTAEAKQNNKTFYQAAIFPFPKNKVRLEIDARQWDGSFQNLFAEEIDPKDYFILNENTAEFEVKAILQNGDPDKKVDLVILAEGYTQKEKQKFLDDAQRVTDMLFEAEPFHSEQKNFNVNAVFTPSQESGTDVPGEKIYRKTAFNSSFYTFDVPRYLTTTDMKSIYDAASAVPYDHVYALVNTERYGGGGFYNFLSVCTSDNELTQEVFIHEFGHGFAGLGDEYYTSSVAYEDFYNLKIEPWEPNLTTLVDFDKKWKSMLEKSTPVPTPREAKYFKTVGVYEGGGYLDKGIYSPYIDCRMKSNEAKGFCPVCQEAIRKVIRSHVE